MKREIFFLACLGAAPATAAELPAQRASFTAQGVVQIDEDRVVFKVYHLEGKERQEMSVDGLYQITILRPDLDKAYVVQPEAASSIELPLDEVRFLPDHRGGGAHELERLGADKEAGEATTRYRLVAGEAAERHYDLMLWVTDDGITMRAEGEIEFQGVMESIMMLRREVRRGPLDPALFEPGSIAFEAPADSGVPESHRKLGVTGP